MDCTVSLTLIVSDLPIHILRQAAHMREVEHHFIKASFLDLLPTSAAFCYPWFPKLGCVNPMQYFATLLRFEGGDMGGCLWIFASKRGELVVACRNQMVATMSAEEGMGEREVAFAD